MTTKIPKMCYYITVFFLCVSLAGIIFGCQNSETRNRQGLYAKDRPLSPEEMKAVRTCMASCTQMCQKNQDTLQNVATSLDKADQALQSGDMTAAQKEVSTSLAAIQATQKTMEKMMKEMPAANVCCPLSGKPIDITNLPSDKVRMHKGVKVGFGNKADMAQWDTLTDAEKEEKIKRVVPDYMSTNLFTYTR